MKRKLDIWMGGALLAGLLTALAGAQSLGEYARQQRAKKGPPAAGIKEYTNDNLPTSGGLSGAGAAAGASSSATASKGEEKKDDRGKLEATWRAKFKEQKDKIALLQSEMEVSQREYQNRRGMVYNDPSMVASWQQHPDKFKEEELKYENERKEKEKELADAKQRLEDMAEELRRAGLPSSWAD